MKNWIDLHCHYLPAIDDGVRTSEEGVALINGLYELGFSTIVATPHIRPTMWPKNKRSTLAPYFERFLIDTQDAGIQAQLVLSAEHFFDEYFVELSAEQQVLPYPGDKAILVEFAYGSLPIGIDRFLFAMRVKGLLPVIAHPERYGFDESGEKALLAMRDAGYPFLLDVMSLTGKYGRGPQQQAERFLDGGHYFAACSDAHKPEDLGEVGQAIRFLQNRIGDQATNTLFADNPRSLVNFAVS